MRKGGFEPPHLAALPPQDSVSTDSTTSAKSQFCTEPEITVRSEVAASGHRPMGAAVRNRQFLMILHRVVLTVDRLGLAEHSQTAA